MGIAHGGSLLLMVDSFLGNFLVCMSSDGRYGDVPSSSWFAKGGLPIVLKDFHERI